MSAPYLLLNILILHLFLTLIFSVYILFSPSPVTEVSQENYSCLTVLPLLNTMINSKYARGIQAANVLLSLRLVGIQDQSLEQQLIQEVKENKEKKGEYIYSLESLG